MNNSTSPHKGVPGRSAGDGAGDADGRGRVDFLTRYFLRRLAIARRKGRFASAQYRAALVEVITFAIILPLVGLLSFAGVASLRWVTPAQAVVPSKYIIAAIVLTISFVLGNKLLGSKFEKYKEDLTCCLDYDSNRDRQVAAFQKTAGFVICAIIMPWLGALIAFWGRL